MRTTIRLDDSLLRDAKVLAARTGRTLTSVIEDALRESLARRKIGAEGDIQLPVFRPVGRHGLRPGVDLSDSAALLDLMEGTQS